MRRLKTKIAAGAKPTVRLGLCGALILVPLLLLATPRQASRTDGVAHRGAPSSQRPLGATVLSSYQAAEDALSAATAAWSEQAAQQAAAQAAATKAAQSAQATQQAAAKAAQQAAVSTRNQLTGSSSWYQAPIGTCASPTLSFGTEVTVTYLATGASVTCVVDDREEDATRVLDLAQGTFAQLASLSTGLIEVRLSW